MTYYPQPRKGILGSWDRFVGPGMTVGENLLVLGSTAIGGLFVAFQLAALHFDWLHVLLGALIGADVIGGAVCNMTATTKFWYHRREQASKNLFGFIALHILHITAVAWAFRGDGFDIIYAFVLGSWLLGSATVVMSASRLLRSPIAALLYVVTLGISLYWLGPTSGMEWFVPLLFVKLLIGHAVPPFEPRT